MRSLQNQNLIPITNLNPFIPYKSKLNFIQEHIFKFSIKNGLLIIKILS